MGKYRYKENESSEWSDPVRGRVLRQLVQEGTVTPDTLIENVDDGSQALARDFVSLFPKTASEGVAQPESVSTESPSAIQMPDKPNTSNPFSATMPATEKSAVEDPFSRKCPVPTPEESVAKKPITVPKADDHRVKPPPTTPNPQNFRKFFFACGQVIDTFSTWCQITIIVSLFMIIVGGIVWSCLPSDWQERIGGLAKHIRVVIRLEEASNVSTGQDNEQLAWTTTPAVADWNR